jgi:hypothetical protein
MFGNVFDKIQSLFSRSFLLGAYFPVLIFAVTNAVIGLLGLPREIVSIDHMKHLWPTNTTAQTALTAGIFISIGVIAYMLSGLNELLRRILEGRYLQPDLERWLMERVRTRINELRDEVNRQRQALTERRRSGRIAMRRLELAAAAANPPNPLPAGDQVAVHAAEQSLNAAANMLASDNQFSTQLDTTVTAVDAALRANRTKETQGTPQEPIASALDRICKELEKQIERSVNEAGRQFNAAWSALYDNYIPEEPRPTRLGNLRAVAESYSAKTYGVRFDYLWPRLQPLLLKDDKMGAMAELAKAQLDFSLLMLGLTVTTTAVWFLVLPFIGNTAWVFIVICAVGPAAIRFFYLMVEESQILHGAVIQSCVDVFRLNTLAVLRQPLPDTLAIERQIWGDLQSLRDAENKIDVRFVHPKT